MFVPSHVQNLEFLIRFESCLMFLVGLAWFVSVEFYQKLRHDRPRRSPRHYHLLYFSRFMIRLQYFKVPRQVIVILAERGNYLKNSLNERKFFVFYKMFGQLVMKRIHFFNQRIIWKCSAYKGPFFVIVGTGLLVNNRNFWEKLISQRIQTFPI